jgi:hypothetical protein
MSRQGILAVTIPRQATTIQRRDLKTKDMGFIQISFKAYRQSIFYSF